MSPAAKPLVLLTGASGFIAAQILHSFVGRGYRVRATVRSEKSAEGVRRTHAQYADKLEVVVIGDMSNGECWTPALFKDVYAVLHTATAFNFSTADPETEVIEPTIVGTTSLLAAIAKHAPQVKRVVYLSSVVAVWDLKSGPKKGVTYTEDHWNPVTRAEGIADPAHAYPASKTLAEHAAWDFMLSEKPQFALTTLCPPLVMGPLEQHDASISKLNTSSALLWPYLSGELKAPERTIYAAYVHVKDVADAHVFAVEKEAAKNRRYLISGGSVQWTEVARLYREEFPELGDRVPDPALTPMEDGFDASDNSRSVKELGIQYRGMRETFLDAGRSLLALK